MEWLTLLIISILLYIVFVAIKFYYADADLALLKCSINPEYFKGKVVWVTGASSGIGEELCRQLSKLGAKVILSARSVDKLASIKDTLAHPENSQVIELDLSDKDSIEKAATTVKQLYERIDILVNNAGITMRGSFIDMGEHGRKVVEVDLLGTASLTRLALQKMLEQGGGGHIVNISSMGAKAATPIISYYCAAKFGLHGLMNVIRFELSDQNISVTNVCPGPVRTNVIRNAITIDGTVYGKKDKLIEAGMPVERCCELILIATSNKLKEVWISKQPYLLLTYLSQYMPSLYHFMIKKWWKSPKKGHTRQT